MASQNYRIRVVFEGWAHPCLSEETYTESGAREAAAHVAARVGPTVSVEVVETLVATTVTGCYEAPA